MFQKAKYLMILTRTFIWNSGSKQNDGYKLSDRLTSIDDRFLKEWLDGSTYCYGADQILSLTHFSYVFTIPVN